MHNSATVRNTMTDVVQCRQHMKTIVNRSSEMYQLDADDCNEEIDSLYPLVDPFVSENGLHIFKGFTPLSRDKFEVVRDRIGVQVITDWISDRGLRCKTTPKDVFFIVLPVFYLPTKWENHGVIFGMTVQKVQKTRWKALSI